MKKLESFALSHIGGGVSQDFPSRGNIHGNQQAGIVDDVISGLIVQGIIFILSVIGDCFFKKKSDDKESEESEKSQYTPSGFGLSLGTSF